MDQLSAHLDRGWDLVQRGDAPGAEVSARRALEMDGQSPEAYNLLGYSAALQGEFEEAVESYRQAIALDDTYLEAMLNAAEVYIYPLGDFEEAIHMCEAALDLSETDDELADALLLLFDALLAKNDMEGARAVCARLPSGPLENPNHEFLMGRAFYEIGDLARGAPLVEKAAQAGPKNPEAQYYLGLVKDELGDVRAATDAFLRARELDLEAPAPAWSLGRDAFAELVKKLVTALPDNLRIFVRQDELWVSDVPGLELVVDGVDPRALVLLDGIAHGAQDKRDGAAEGPPSARLFVYQKNVERVAGSADAVEAEIKAALEREITATFVEPPREEPGAELRH